MLIIGEIKHWTDVWSEFFSAYWLENMLILIVIQLTRSTALSKLAQYVQVNI